MGPQIKPKVKVVPVAPVRRPPPPRPRPPRLLRHSGIRTTIRTGSSRGVKPRLRPRPAAGARATGRANAPAPIKKRSTSLGPPTRRPTEQTRFRAERAAHLQASRIEAMSKSESPGSRQARKSTLPGQASKRVLQAHPAGSATSSFAPRPREPRATRERRRQDTLARIEATRLTAAALRSAALVAHAIADERRRHSR
jgi:hypothetical protein